MKKVKLKELIEKPITGEWGNEGNSVKVLRTTNFTNRGVLNLKNVVERSIAQEKISNKKLYQGDIIIEKSGGSPNQPVGRVVFFDIEGEYLCNNFTSVLRPKEKLVFPKFLHYQLFAAHKFGVTEMFQNKTTGIINLQLPRYIEKLDIPLPPIETQKRIASILDDAQALKQKTEKLLEEYDDLAQSIFLDMFGDPVTNPKGWNIKKLCDLIKALETGKSVNSTDEKYLHNRLCVLKTSCVYSGTFNSNEAKVIKSAELDMAKLNPKKDSIIISRMNTPELVGKSAYIYKDYPNLFLPDRLWQTVKSELNYNVLWLSFAISQKRFMGNVSRISSGTSGSMKNISKKKYLNLSIIFPPVQFQNKFANKITLIEKQKELAKKELQESEALFNCLLQKAFKGELT